MTAYIPLLAMVVFAYLLGSIPSGLIIARRTAFQDIRTRGSGNIGATNVARIAGKRRGLITLICDIAKGALPVLVAGLLREDLAPLQPDALPALVAMAAFFGHLYPAYLKCKTGGKGVATAAGCFLVLCPAACASSMGVFSLVLWRSRYVSAASLSAALSLPLFAVLYDAPSAVIGAGCLICAFILARHRGNLKRLRNGTEPTIGQPTAATEEKTLTNQAEPVDPIGHPLPFSDASLPVVRIRVTDELDLHTYHPKEIGGLLADYFSECRAAGILRVRIIHGKGTGVLKRQVHARLKKMPEVIDFREAPPASGGWGATIVNLRP